MTGLLRVAAAAMCVAIVAGAAAQTSVPHEFQSGTPARASEVNENFDELEIAIDQNAADIASVPVIEGLSREAAQIQSALYLTSGLRWLVADIYDPVLNFPRDNIQAGAAPGADWSNKFVSGSFVRDGVIEITFSDAAAPAIANQIISLTPNVAAPGVVWFECSGDGVTDTYLAELDCAFADEPYKPVYDLRQQILTAFDLLEQSDALAILQDYRNTTGEWPMDNAQAGLHTPTGYRNQYIDQMYFELGVLNVVFGGDAHPTLVGTILYWEPRVWVGSIQWNCGSSTILDILLPAYCR